MQKTIEKKLRLSKETLRDLVPEELRQVAGGSPTCGRGGGITGTSGESGFPTDTNTTVGWCHTGIPI